jgi:hypothetical protein
VDGPDGLLEERFAALAGPADGDWGEVRRRARRGAAKLVVAATVLVVALAAAGLAVGGRIVGLFDVHGKTIALDSLPQRERDMLVTSMCPHPELNTVPGKPPQADCREGNPTVAEIANDGAEVHYRITYPWGLTCVGSGPVGGYHDPNRGDFLIGMLGCNAGAPGRRLVPTPKRPITVDAVGGSSTKEPRMHLIRVSGLAGEGIAKVALVSRGARVVTDVHGHAYSFAKIPMRQWNAIVALDASGAEVYREPVLGGPPRTATPKGAVPRHRLPPPPRPRGRPVQRISTPVASLDVYRNAFVVLRFSSTASEAYRRLARSAATVDGRVGFTCASVAYGSGRWKDVSGGATVQFRPVLRSSFGNGPFAGGMPSPPYDFCEVSGTYGRYWNDEEGPHEVVEVPFTGLGRRYLDERATARDLAYWVRTKKLHRIRLAIHRGETGPSATELARIFGPRLVPLRSRDATAPTGKVGVWTDGKIIVASELTPAGRRLYVTVRGARIGATNIRDLAFAF